MTVEVPTHSQFVVVTAQKVSLLGWRGGAVLTSPIVDTWYSEIFYLEITSHEIQHTFSGAKENVTVFKLLFFIFFPATPVI